MKNNVGLGECVVSDFRVPLQSWRYLQAGEVKKIGVRASIGTVRSKENKYMARESSEGKNGYQFKPLTLVRQ